jgi:hypothetical protein
MGVGWGVLAAAVVDDVPVQRFRVQHWQCSASDVKLRAATMLS